MTVSVSNKITIENFVVIKKAEIDIKDINIIIGPQANGKSLIAKLIYYFNSLSKVFRESVEKDFSKEALDEDVVAKFYERFPSYLWERDKFKIEYICGNVEISISNKKGKSKKDSANLVVEYGSHLFSYLEGEAKKYHEIMQNRKISNIRNIGIENFIKLESSFKSTRDRQKKFNPIYFGDSLFVPAGRSFFAILHKNIFTIMSQNINVDPLIKEFGSFYEGVKSNFAGDDDLEEELEPLYKDAFNAIAKGQYLYDDEKDWIVSPNGLKTNLTDTSSGQQESIPLLLALTIYPQLRNLFDIEHMIFIEEPEAHLFPTAQGDVISLLSSIYAEFKTRFFITTHSPYVLAALNNMIQAGEVAKNGKLSQEEFREINGGGEPISYENISGYTIEDGVARSIMDEEFKIIGGYSLDEVSSHFQDVMNAVLERDVL